MLKSKKGSFPAVWRNTVLHRRPVMPWPRPTRPRSSSCCSLARKIDPRSSNCYIKKSGKGLILAKKHRIRILEGLMGISEKCDYPNLMS